MTQPKPNSLDWELKRLAAYGVNPQDILSSQEIETLEAFDQSKRYNEIGEEINPMTSEQKAIHEKLFAAIFKASEKYYGKNSQQNM